MAPNLEEEAVEEEDLDFEVEEAILNDNAFDEGERAMTDAFSWAKRISCIAHSIVCALKRTAEQCESIKPILDRAHDVSIKLN